VTLTTIPALIMRAWTASADLGIVRVNQTTSLRHRLSQRRRSGRGEPCRRRGFMKHHRHGSTPGARARSYSLVSRQDGQAVAQRKRMPCLAFLNQQPARIAFRPRSHWVDAHHELTLQMDRSVGAGQALDCSVAIRGAGQAKSTSCSGIRIPCSGSNSALKFPARLRREFCKKTHAISAH
jgi:hypothetical protein